MNDEEVDVGEEAGGESGVHVLKARDPSFFATPWDPPEIEAAIDERPQTLMVATKQHLTPVQRVFIRIDATVRLNRIWKGRYDRFNGHHFIEALKDAAVYPVPRPESSKIGKGLLALGEGEGEKKGPKGEGEGGEDEEEEVDDKETDLPEFEGEYGGPDLIQKVLEALKFVQEKHNEAWMKKEVEMLCNEYHRKAQEIIETKRDWKARVVKLQMEWADQWTNYLLAMQNKFAEMKNEIEDHEMMKALELYESELQQVASEEVEEKAEESDLLVPGVPTKVVGVEEKEAQQKAAEEEEVDLSTLSPLERIKRYVIEKQKKKEREEKAAAARRLLEEEEEEGAVKIGNYLSAADEMEEQEIGEEADYDSDVLRGDDHWKAKYVPLKFKMNILTEPRITDTSSELRPISMPVKAGILEDGTVIREIPLFVREPEEQPTRRQIEDNLASGIEKRDEDPNINPFEWAMKKTVQEFLEYQGRKRDNSRGGKNMKSSPRFARVGVLRTVGPRTEFIPNIRNFDAKTRAILESGNQKEIRKLPRSVLKVTTLNGTPCSLETKASGFKQGHVTFLGVMSKFESKSLMRIFIEETMSPEGYRKRYKGKDWMKRKLNKLYDEFNAKKNEVIKGGLEGRIITERNSDTRSACPIFWDISNYLRRFMQPKDDKSSLKPFIPFPLTIKSLKRMFYNIIVHHRPELGQKFVDLQHMLSKWGGLEICQIDLESVVNLMWILSEMDEFKLCWEEIKDTVISSTTCPLCLLFNFIQRSVDKASNVTLQEEENQRKTTVKWHLGDEIKSLTEIAEEFKARERPIMNPALFPDKNVFHILTTVDEKRKTNAFRLGQDRKSTRSFVMRSCSTVIFDISRSVKEIPWIWDYLKHHMELLDKKDVRDEADIEPMKHLILITNFLSWAKSPPLVRTNISEKTFHQRIPHPDYLDHYKVENTVYYIGVNYKQFKLRTTIIYTGIPFGEEEDVMIYLFKMAWDNELELPLFGNGRNVLPLIHITDLTWIVVRTVNERTYPSMIFALNKNDQTLFAIASRIAKAFGSSKVVKFPSPDFKMKFCIPKIIDDLLKQNVKYMNVDTPYKVRALWNNAFLKEKKLQAVINDLRETRKLYGKTVLLIGPPSKAKSELAIIISKLYNLPLIHKNNILNYYMRATQGREPQEGGGGEEEEEDEEAKAEEEEEAEKVEDEDEDEEKKAKKPIDPLAQEKRFAKQLKKLMDGKDKNKARKQLTKLLQKLLQSVFIQSHGYVLVDWPVRKEDTIALFTKILEEPPPEEEMIDEKPQAPPPPRPDIVIHVSAPDQYLDEKSYFLFQDLALKSLDEMQYDLLEYRYYRQLHQSVVDLFEERNNPIYRISNHDGIKVVGKLVCILGEPQQASGRWIYEIFLQNEKACDEKIIEKGKRKEKEAKWLRKQYKHAVNRMLTCRRRENYSLREQLLGKPMDAFKEAERISPNLRSIVDSEYQEWRNMKDQIKLKGRWTNRPRVWDQVENRRWIAAFEKMKEYWME